MERIEFVDEAGDRIDPDAVVAEPKHAGARHLARAVDDPLELDELEVGRDRRHRLAGLLIFVRFAVLANTLRK